MCNTEKIKSGARSKLGKAARIFKGDSYEILEVKMEEGSVLPPHSSPTDAHLIMLGGRINFYIDDTCHSLVKNDHFNFPGKREHGVQAPEESHFLIIR